MSEALARIHECSVARLPAQRLSGRARRLAYESRLCDPDVAADLLFGYFAQGQSKAGLDRRSLCARHYLRAADMRNMPNGQWVYVLLALGTGLIKIGTSAKLKLRIRNLRAGSPVPLVPLVAYPGGEDAEHKAHVFVGRHRTHSEWFRCDKRSWQLVDETALCSQSWVFGHVATLTNGLEREARKIASQRRGQ